MRSRIPAHAQAAEPQPADEHTAPASRRHERRPRPGSRPPPGDRALGRGARPHRRRPRSPRSPSPRARSASRAGSTTPRGSALVADAGGGMARHARPRGPPRRRRRQHALRGRRRAGQRSPRDHRARRRRGAPRRAGRAARRIRAACSTSASRCATPARHPYTVQSMQVDLPRAVGRDRAARHHRAPPARAHAAAARVHVRHPLSARAAAAGPGADATLLLAAGRPGFGFERGRVHGIHVAWSGNHRVLAERVDDRRGVPRRRRAARCRARSSSRRATSMQTPWVIGSWGDGLTELSAPLPRRVARAAAASAAAAPGHAQHVGGRVLRPLPREADRARGCRGRRRRRALRARRRLVHRPSRRHRGPRRLVRRRRRVAARACTRWSTTCATLGMEFGLWVEPEMVNPDSDLARAHPDWILRGRMSLPPSARQQQVLDLAHPEAYAYIAGRLHALLDEYPIAYLKWDHNRDLVDAGSGPEGVAGCASTRSRSTACSTSSRRRHPGLEIESCASGGARVDLGILDRTDRIWTSDSLDPLERLANQRYTGLVVPPELMGMHLTSPVVHSSGRTVALGSQRRRRAVRALRHRVGPHDGRRRDPRGDRRVGRARQAPAAAHRDGPRRRRRRHRPRDRRARHGRRGRGVRRLHDHPDRDDRRLPRRADPDAGARSRPPLPPARHRARRRAATTPGSRRSSGRSTTPS